MLWDAASATLKLFTLEAIAAREPVPSREHKEHGPTAIGSYRCADTTPYPYGHPSVSTSRSGSGYQRPGDGLTTEMSALFNLLLTIVVTIHVTFRQLLKPGPGQ